MDPLPSQQLQCNPQISEYPPPISVSSISSALRKVWDGWGCWVSSGWQKQRTQEAGWCKIQGAKCRTWVPEREKIMVGDARLSGIDLPVKSGLGVHCDKWIPSLQMLQSLLGRLETVELWVWGFNVVSSLSFTGWDGRISTGQVPNGKMVIGGQDSDVTFKSRILLPIRRWWEDYNTDLQTIIPPLLSRWNVPFMGRHGQNSDEIYHTFHHR